MARLNSPTPAPRPLLLGFCDSKDQETLLLAAGFKPVWRKGRDSESMTSVEGYARRRPYTLGVATDLRLLCESGKRKDIVKAIGALERQAVTIRDIRFSEMTHAELQDMACKIAGNARFTQNRRKARYEGGKGGTAKGIAAAARRNARCADDIVERLLDTDLSYKTRAWVLGDGFSASSLARQHNNI